MTNITQTPAYRVAFSMYVALGGDKTRIFDSVDAIYAEIDKFYGKGSRITTEALTLEITENRAELYNDDAITGYKPVSISVNVPQKYTDEQVEELQETSRQQGYDSGYDKGIADGYVQGESEGYTDGYAEGLEDGAEDQKALLEEITIRDNGVYEKEDGYKKVTVEVAGSGGGDTGKPKIYNGFTLNYSRGKNAIAASQLKNIDFSAYDWSNMNDLSYFFANFSGTFTNDDFDSFDANFNGKMRVCAYMFNPTTGSNGTITSVPSFLSSKIKDCVLLDNLFYEQRLLTNVNELANWDTKNAISTYQMFYLCNKLTSVPLFDTSNVINMSNMFHTCEVLTSVPLFDTSNVKNMTGMFQACYKLTSVPLFDTSNVINMRNMFYNCSKLTAIPQFDTRNVVDMAGMFQTCRELITIPELDTSKVVTMDSMFNTCIKLESLPLMDAGQLTNLNTFFGYSNITTLTYLGGFKDLGKQNSISGTDSTYFLAKAPNLPKESVMNVINNLYDRAAVGLSIKTLKLHANHLAMLTDEEKAIATNKGWTVS